jgi:hypothetical protein
MNSVHYKPFFMHATDCQVAVKYWSSAFEVADFLGVYFVNWPTNSCLSSFSTIGCVGSGSGELIIVLPY